MTNWTVHSTPMDEDVSGVAFELFGPGKRVACSHLVATGRQLYVCGCGCKSVFCGLHCVANW